MSSSEISTNTTDFSDDSRISKKRKMVEDQTECYHYNNAKQALIHAIGSLEFKDDNADWVCQTLYKDDPKKTMDLIQIGHNKQDCKSSMLYQKSMPDQQPNHQHSLSLSSITFEHPKQSVVSAISRKKWQPTSKPATSTIQTIAKRAKPDNTTKSIEIVFFDEENVGPCLRSILIEWCDQCAILRKNRKYSAKAAVRKLCTVARKLYPDSDEFDEKISIDILKQLTKKEATNDLYLRWWLPFVISPLRLSAANANGKTSEACISKSFDEMDRLVSLAFDQKKMNAASSETLWSYGKIAGQQGKKFKTNVMQTRFRWKLLEGLFYIQLRNKDYPHATLFKAATELVNKNNPQSDQNQKQIYYVVSCLRIAMIASELLTLQQRMSIFQDSIQSPQVLWGITTSRRNVMC